MGTKSRRRQRANSEAKDEVQETPEPNVEPQSDQNEPVTVDEAPTNEKEAVNEDAQGSPSKAQKLPIAAEGEKSSHMSTTDISTTETGKQGKGTTEVTAPQIFPAKLNKEAACPACTMM